MPRPRRIDVELGDETPLPAVDVPAEPRVGDRRRWWWLAAPVAVVLALVAGQVVTDRQERARLDALAELPGVVVPVDGPVEVAWDVDEGTRLEGGARVGTVLVTSRVASDGAVALVGLDTATGARRWGLDVVAAPSAPWWPDPTECAVVPDGSGHVACLVTDGGTRDVEGRRARVAARAPRLLVVDAAAGTVEVDRVAPVWAQWPTPAGDDVLLVGDVDGTLHVTSQDLREGTERWSATAEGTAVAAGASSAVAALLDERTLAVEHGGGVTLVSTDGAVLRTAGVAPQGGLTGQVPTRSVVASPPLGAVLVSDGATTTVVSGTGEVLLDGSAPVVMADDGSVPGLVLTRTPRLQAWDARDGSPRWRSTVVDAQDVTVLEGRVHVGTSAAVVTFDGTTGEELWRFGRPTGSGAVLTDGRYLFVQARQGERHSAPYDLVALHRADGSEAWRAPLPERSWPQSVAGLLVATSYGPNIDRYEEIHRVLRGRA